MGCLTRMHRTRHAFHRSLRNPPEVIGIDLKADAELFCNVNAQRGGHAAKCFCQRHRSATMKHTERLVGPVVDRHGCLQVIVANVGETYAQVLHHGVGRHGIETGNGSGTVKNSHGEGKNALTELFAYFCAQISAKLSSKKIYVVRHGQTDFNLRNIVQGSGVDSDLNARGREQARAFYEAYKNVTFDKVYTSALRRTRQSVQTFIDDGLPAESLAGLNEISWGTKEGHRITPEEDEYYHYMLRQWQLGDTSLRIEGGESPDDVVRRMQPAVDHIMSKQEERTVLVCMHGRAIRILLCMLLNYPLRSMDSFDHENLCLYQLHHNGMFFTLDLYNDTRHLRLS